MAIVICTLPNASTRINGVTFAADRGQMISDDVDDATAAHFRAIPGYMVVGDEPPASVGNPDGSTDGAAPLLVATGKGRKTA